MPGPSPSADPGLQRGASEAYDKDIRGWEKKTSKITKPRFSKSGEETKEPPTEADMRGRTPSEAYDKNIRGWGGRKNVKPSFTEGVPRSVSEGDKETIERGASDIYDKPIRGWGGRKNTKPSFAARAASEGDNDLQRSASSGATGGNSSDYTRSASSMSSTTAAFDKPVRGWGFRKSTKPSFKEPVQVAPVAEDYSVDAEVYGDGDDRQGGQGDGDYYDDYDDEEEYDDEEFEPPPQPRRDFKGPHVLVTGGQGYVGSHTILRLLEEGYVVTCIDNEVNSHPEALERVRGIVTEDQAAHLFTHKLDLCDMVTLKATMAAISCIKRIDACVHLASLNPTGTPDKSTRESVRYHQNNVVGTMNLFSVLAVHGCRKVVFSSSGMVYGDRPMKSPLNEGDIQAGGKMTNPYARGKAYVEGIMQDMCKSPVDGRAWGMVSLRYYHAVGAHPSGRIGEDPTVCPANNLLREVVQVSLGRRPELIINGDTYDTADGTCVRDYVHVMDLAEGHLAAIKKMGATKGYHCYNLGTQEGISDLKVVDAMETATGLKIKVKVGKRKQGDVATAFVNPDLAWTELEWLPSRGITEICKDLWAWTKANPDGYVGRDLKQTFGQFKPVSFSKASMPKLSSNEGSTARSKKKKEKGLAQGGMKRLDTMDEYEASMGQAF